MNCGCCRNRCPGYYGSINFVCEDLNFGDNSFDYFTYNDEYIRLCFSKEDKRYGEVRGVYYRPDKNCKWCDEFGMSEEWIRKIDLNTALFCLKDKPGFYYRAKKYKSFKLILLDCHYPGVQAEVNVSDLLISERTLTNVPFSFNQQCFPCCPIGRK
ncbi:hypothetical protein EZS27_010884 [termite gut metagenome]|uniref:Uncharacterized protein n=1 Tax=termite gut metagenome TaxID=433724 RepID=A0A5J4S564_9ZZZZ